MVRNLVGGIEIRHRDGQGLHVVATRASSAGAVLIQEPAYVTGCAPDPLGTCCRHCLDPLPPRTKGVVYCPACSCAFYCSSGCVSRDVKAHVGSGECWLFQQRGECARLGIWAREASAALRLRHAEPLSPPFESSTQQTLGSLVAEEGAPWVEGLVGLMVEAANQGQVQLSTLSSNAADEEGQKGQEGKEKDRGGSEGQEQGEASGPREQEQRPGPAAEPVSRDSVVEALCQVLLNAPEAVQDVLPVQQCSAPPITASEHLNAMAQATPGQGQLRVQGGAGWRLRQGPAPAGLYRHFCRINHSCRPSAAYHFRPGGAVVVRALAPLEPGQELTVSYTDALQPLAERRADLQRRYGFTCRCERCCEEEAAEQARAQPDGAQQAGMQRAQAGLKQAVVEASEGLLEGKAEGPDAVFLQAHQQLAGLLRGGIASPAGGLPSSSSAAAGAVAPGDFHPLDAFELHALMASAASICARTAPGDGSTAGQWWARALCCGVLQAAAAERLLCAGETGAVTSGARFRSDLVALTCEALACSTTQLPPGLTAAPGPAGASAPAGPATASGAGQEPAPKKPRTGRAEGNGASTAAGAAAGMLGAPNELLDLDRRVWEAACAASGLDWSPWAHAFEWSGQEQGSFEAASSTSGPSAGGQTAGQGLLQRAVVHWLARALALLELAYGEAHSAVDACQFTPFLYSGASPDRHSTAAAALEPEPGAGNETPGGLVAAAAVRAYGGAAGIVQEACALLHGRYRIIRR